VAFWNGEGSGGREPAYFGGWANVPSVVIRGLSIPALRMSSTTCAASAPTSSSTTGGSRLRRDAVCPAWLSTNNTRRGMSGFALVPGCCCRRSEVVSGSLGAELAEEAAVVGPDELLDESTLVVEPEDVHEVHDDAGTGGLHLAGG
jgi:hypothetical protein